MSISMGAMTSALLRFFLGSLISWAMDGATNQPSYANAQAMSPAKRLGV